MNSRGQARSADRIQKLASFQSHDNSRFGGEFVIAQTPACLDKAAFAIERLGCEVGFADFEKVRGFQAKLML